MDWNEFTDFLKTHGKDAVNTALNSIPGASNLASALEDTPDLWNKIQSSPITKGLAGENLTPEVPNPGNPVMSIAEGALLQPMEASPSMTKAPPTPMPTEEPTPEAVPAEAAPSGAPEVSPDLEAKAGKNLKESDNLLQMLNNDSAKRDAMLAELEKRRKLNIIPQALSGAADSVAGAATAFGANVNQGAQKAETEREAADMAATKSGFDERLKNDPKSDISRQYQGLLAKMLQKDPSDPMIAGRSALQIIEQVPAVEKIAAMQNQRDMKELQLQALKNQREGMDSAKHSTEQDRLEQQAKQAIFQLRGDKSLARAEEQRDAAIVAVNRINEVHKAGKELNPIDYTDILGQIYKARTGAAPGEQLMKDLRQPVGSATFNKAWTFMTGQQAPATSRDISNSLLEMAGSMGKQADTFHAGYMGPHLIKPHGLDPERWDPIVNTARGVSFADATKSAATPTSNTNAQALAWAKANPTDPRSAKIRKKLGM